MSSNREQQFLDHINRHMRIIHKISRMYMDTRENQEDLSQEIIIQLWKSYDSFRNESEFSTWMYKVALNTAITFLKKQQRNNIFSVFDDSAVETSDTNYSDEEEKIASFYKAVYSLNNIEKALIFLYVEGQSHREIAEKLGISEGNARVKLARIKDKLQIIINQQ